MAFTELARNRLYNDARYRVEQVDRVTSPEVAEHRRFIAFGVILGLTKAGALSEDGANELLTLLHTTTPPEIGEAFDTALQAALLPDLPRT